MNKKEARLKFITYLKECNIKFHEYLSDGEASIYMILTGYEKCPNKVLECSVFFFDSCMEARVYYNVNAAKWISEKADDLSDMYRLLNYINAKVWPFTHDGLGGKLYESHHLQTPRFYITEDGNYDLTATTVIDYDNYEMAPLETEDYSTAAIPELMNKLSIPLFFVLEHKMSVEEAIKMIKREVLDEDVN